MEQAQGRKSIWKLRDELSPRNFRRELLAVFLVLPLTVVLGDMCFLDYNLLFLGVDSKNLIMMVYGLGFLPLLFVREDNIYTLLRVSVIAQIPLFLLQILLPAGLSSLFVYLLFHIVNGVSTACGFYLFAFALNNVERLLTMLLLQLYYAVTYLPWPVSAAAELPRVVIISVVLLALCAAAFGRNREQGLMPQPEAEPGAKKSGVSAVIAINAIWYVISLMVMYIEYEETTVSGPLFASGSFLAVAVIIVIMLVFNQSALHLWTLCLVLSVLGVGALHYPSALAVNGGSLIYGLGAGLGFMILFYLQGGALKRSGSYKLFRLCCLFNCLNYFVISGAFFFLFDRLDEGNLALAFPAILVLELICFLLAPVLHDRLFRTDWHDGYHMADMPLYAAKLKQVEEIVRQTIPDGLTRRETEIFTLLLTDADKNMIVDTLKISSGTYNFHVTNLYRKLGIQSRPELFAKYAGVLGRQIKAEGSEKKAVIKNVR